MRAFSALRRRAPPGSSARTRSATREPPPFAPVTPPQRDGGSDETPRATPTPSAPAPRGGGSRARERLEFGGAPGVLAIMTLSHMVAYYVLLCVAKREGRLYPLPLDAAAFAALLADLRELAVPTPASWAAYLGFLGAQLGLALVCPGPVIYGYPVTKSGERADGAADGAADAAKEKEKEKEKETRKDATRRLPYTCNALAAWWVTLLCVGLGTLVLGDAPLVWVAENRGRLLTCAVVVGDVGSLLFYLKGARRWKRFRTTGTSFPYDFFMGTELNPRSFDGKLDWKMFAELRISWVTLFLLTASAVAKQARSRRDAATRLSNTIGDDFLSAAATQVYFRERSRFFAPASHVSAASWLILAAHWLYANACQKGEACVPYTWDVFHEKFGWMLLWWNVAGVPFCYSACSFVVAETDPRLSAAAAAALWAALLAAYYVWDVAQAQRVTFRARFLGSREKRARNENENENENDVDDERKKALARPPGVGLPSRPWAFPKLPWSELSDPTCIETARGVPLLTSGFTGMAWKAHYTADMCMALVWALAAGGSPSRTPAAFLYPAFFLVMIAHRARRDETRCLAKYGEDWRRFRKAVPYVWVPGIA